MDVIARTARIALQCLGWRIIIERDEAAKRPCTAVTDCDRIVAHTPQRKRRARRDALEVDGERGDAHPRPERKVSSIVREPDLGLSGFTEKTFRADDRRHYRREPFLFEMDQVIP